MADNPVVVSDPSKTQEFPASWFSPLTPELKRHWAAN